MLAIEGDTKTCDQIESANFNLHSFFDSDIIFQADHKVNWFINEFNSIKNKNKMIPSKIKRKFLKLCNKIELLGITKKESKLLRSLIAQVMNKA